MIKKTVHQNSEYCKNCGQHLLLHQKFCHSCGQKADTHRINFHFLVHEVQHSIFHVDGGILYTLKHLFTRPGHMLREYLEGKRIHHFKPVLMLIIIGSINGLLTLFLKGNSKKDSILNVNTEFRNNPDQKEINKALDIPSFVEYFMSIVNWFGDHIAFFILLIIPAVSLGFYFGFKKYKINYAEWLIVMTYFAAMALASNLPFIVIEKVSGMDFSLLYFLIMIGFSFWIMLQFFNKKKDVNVVFRTIWSQFLVFIFTLIFMLISTFVITAVGIAIHGNYTEFIKMYEQT